MFLIIINTLKMAEDGIIRNELRRVTRDVRFCFLFNFVSYWAEVQIKGLTLNTWFFFTSPKSEVELYYAKVGIDMELQTGKICIFFRFVNESFCIELCFYHRTVNFICLNNYWNVNRLELSVFLCYLRKVAWITND